MSYPSNEPNSSEDNRVPLFGTWRRAYTIVIAVFAIEVALFYALTRYFA